MSFQNSRINRAGGAGEFALCLSWDDVPCWYETGLWPATTNQPGAAMRGTFIQTKYLIFAPLRRDLMKLGPCNSDSEGGQERGHRIILSTIRPVAGSFQRLVFP